MCRRSRFILNLPDEELTSLERICFQVEQAYGSVWLSLILLAQVLAGTGSTKTLSEKKIVVVILYH